MRHLYTIVQLLGKKMIRIFRSNKGRCFCSPAVVPLQYFRSTRDVVLFSTSSANFYSTGIKYRWSIVLYSKFVKEYHRQFSSNRTSNEERSVRSVYLFAYFILILAQRRIEDRMQL